MLGQEIFSSTDYLEILYRRRKIIMQFFLSTVIAVTLGTFLMRPVYRATAVLLIDVESPNVEATTAGVAIGSQGGYNYYSYREYFKSQMEIITSRPIIKRVFDEFNLANSREYARAKDPIKKFLKTIDVEAVRDTRLLKLSVDNPDPALAAKMANRIAAIYIRHNLNYISKSEWLNLLKNEYLTLQSKLSEYSKIYKDEHPEMIRLKAEIAEVAKNIAKEKDANPMESDFDREKLQGQWGTLALGGLKANNVSITEYAYEPITPIKPHKLLNILMAIVFGSFGGAGLALFFEYQDATVKDIEDVERLTNWSFLGKIPEITGTRKELNFHTRPNDFISEAYRSIRTQLLLLDTKEHPLKSLVVSSLGPEEGKTVNICNLAMAIAQNQKRVLLIDADMRRPRLHDVFKNKERKGLCSFLSGQTGFEELIHKTEIENLFLIADERTCNNSAELLNGDKIKEFISLAKKNFDFVLFDSPPLGIISDATIISTVLDGMILVIESRKTPKREVLRNYKLLKNAKIRFVGVIINKAALSGSEGYYYSKAYTAQGT